MLLSIDLAMKPVGISYVVVICYEACGLVYIQLVFVV